ncbi:ATP-binding protein [Roseibium sp. RKSG952]|uniref:ATP-binding protein n=1 Tax=Roseibium sp. RKSG952 TaxID=2529384 RepID=UPI0013CAB569|nr:ATP-binding protein [Roseibium sp. RKSG952]MTH94981.1 response regulator [Roseibium sp. RKSG952]
MAPPKIDLLEDARASSLLLRLESIHSKISHIVEPQGKVFLAELRNYEKSVSRLISFYDVTSKHYEALEKGADPVAISEELIKDLENISDIDNTLLLLSVELQRKRNLIEDDWRQAARQSYESAFLTLGALFLASVLGILFVFRFIRNQQTIEALKEAERARAETFAERVRFREVLQELPIGVRLTDQDGSEVFSNDSISKELWSRIPTAVCANSLHQFCSDKGGIKRFSVDEKGTHLEGRYKRLSDQSNVEVLYDVSELVLAERKAVEAKQAAETADKAKTTFLAIMSHEIRTPLYGVVGSLELLQETTLSKSQESLVATVNHSASSLLTIINDVLDYSKMEAGEVTLEHIPVSLSNIVDQSIKNFAKLAADKDIDINTSLEGIPPNDFLADPTRIGQVINNLVSNAIKFTDNGSIVISVAHMSSDESVDTLRFSVKDTGVGICKYRQNDLFLDFRQADISTSRRYGGTGLGLSICQRLVTLMGGEIGVESELGNGAEFFFTVTLQRVEQNNTVEEISPDTNNQTESDVPVFAMDDCVILVVDDSDINRRLLQQQLALIGCRTVSANNGEEAWDFWRQQKFSLVLTDCHMPELDGYALTERIRQNEKDTEAQTTIIGITASILGGERDKGRKSGMDDVLSKPIKLVDLKTAIDKWAPVARLRASGAQNKPTNSDGSININDAKQFASRAGGNTFIDVSHLDELYGEVSHEVFTRLHRIFCSSYPDTEYRIQTCIARENFSELQHIAHTARGDASAIGATMLAEMLELLEQTAAQNDACKSLKLLQEIRNNANHIMRLDPHLSLNESERLVNPTGWL